MYPHSTHPNSSPRYSYLPNLSSLISTIRGSTLQLPIFRDVALRPLHYSAVLPMRFCNYVEMSVLRFAMKLLLLSSVFPGTNSFVNKNLAISSIRKSSAYVNHMSTTDRPLPTVLECDLAYDSWMKLYDTIPMTAPNYLTKEACIKKFCNLAKASGDTVGALAMVANDPGVLRFREETVSESYSAWLRKFDGDEQKTLELCVRAPMILALKSKVVDEAKESDVYQTIFFSYVAVVFRGPTKALQMLLKVIFR